MLSASELDAITVDAMGTLVELVDPVDRLSVELAQRGVQRTRDEVHAAFAAEVAYYLPRAHEGRDEERLAELGRACTAVFLEHAGARLDAEEFAPAFVGALEFRALPGTVEALELLRSAGLALACVSNWDVSLEAHLERAGLARFFAAVASSAEASVPKPDPRVFELVLERLRVHPGRAVHVGDAEADREGARAAGLSFEPAPLATLPERLGLRAKR